MNLETITIWIVLAPLIGSAIAGLFGGRIGRAGSHTVTIVGVGGGVFFSSTDPGTHVDRVLERADRALQTTVDVEVLLLAGGDALQADVPRDAVVVVAGVLLRHVVAEVDHVVVVGLVVRDAPEIVTHPIAEEGEEGVDGRSGHRCWTMNRFLLMLCGRE